MGSKVTNAEQAKPLILRTGEAQGKVALPTSTVGATAFEPMHLKKTARAQAFLDAKGYKVQHAK